MPINPFDQGGQLGLDLFGTTALTPADLNPVGLIRIPMKENPVDDTDEADTPAGQGGRSSRSDAARRGTNFRLDGARNLASGWKARAQDNLAAIRLLQLIETQNRPATPEEQAQLIKFCAFSSTELAQGVFRAAGSTLPSTAGADAGEETAAQAHGDEGFRAGWAEIGRDLETLVSPHERAGLMRATQYAHYTPEFIIRALWSAVARLGYAGGRVLEPGCGTGLFLALAPEAIAVNSHFTGIEADPVTARITRLLFPESQIRREDFTKAKLVGDFDLAIGNPPFSDRTQRLTEITPPTAMSLHDYFIARSIYHLRPGGLAAFVVSRWTMDKIDDTARKIIADKADLLGAVRLPAGAMRADAGTDVVVDLLVFRARADDEIPGPVNWTGTAEALPATDETPAVAINRYFLDHPAQVLGTHDRTTSPYGLVYTCKGDTGPGLEAAIHEALAILPSGVHAPDPARFRKPDEVAEPVYTGHAADGATIREGSYLVIRNRLHQVVDGIPTEIPVKQKNSKRDGIPLLSAQIIDGLIPIRDAVREVLRAQEADLPWQQAQQKLRLVYGRFVRTYGAINRTQVVTITDEETGKTRDIVRRPNLAPFADDPDVWLVASIEEYDLDSDKGRHGAIFDRRVIHPPAEPMIETAADALTVCLHDRGSVDPDYIAELLGTTAETVISLLPNAIFLNPETRRWETSDAYLSGPVRTKLAIARAAAVEDPRFESNVTALEAAQPVDLKPSEITARLGATWIPTTVIESFCTEIIGVTTRVSHVREIGSWTINTHVFVGVGACTTEWGTARRHAGELLDDALNSQIPQIWDVWRDAGGSERRELNVVETEAAKEKLSKIKTAFQSWVWTDAERAETLCRIYNDLMNNLVPRHFDGSHLTLPGASSVISFYPHQKRVIWRIIADGATYIAHAVGAGKTFSMAAAVMEQKRLGMITKAMMVVPGHCLAQASREFLQLYPTARILVADETNFAKAKRQRFLARAATGEWDCIIITHSAFKFIAVPASFERSMLEDQISAMEEILTSVDSDDRISRKRIERIKEGFEARLDALGSDKDDLLTIGEIGIDQIIVDEAQEFRKLSFATNMATLKGVDPNGSQRAWDLFVKARFVDQKNPGRALLMASGTPITNTMGELYTLQRFFAEDILTRMGLQHFDGWAANFGDARTDLELQPSGQYKPVTRFSEFVNVPELIDIFRSFADVVQKADLREYLKLPRIATGKRQLVTVEPSKHFRMYQRFLDQRIKEIEARKGKPQKGDDILLSVITDGRHAAIDLRLVTQGGMPDPDSKLNALIDKVFETWRDTAARRYLDASGEPYPNDGAGQMIFSDLGTLNVEKTRGFSAYRWIRDQLVARGVPAGEIAFMQDYRKAADKQRVVSDFNAGRVRILIGSSQTMGTGVNGQKRLAALHHLDVPWLPSDIEQREGRIERQGNQNEEIAIYAYATQTSMDATMWQNNERKQRFIEASLSGDRTIRRLEDAGSQSNQFAMAKAIASGDQRLMQKAGLEAELARLRRLSDAHIDGQISIRRTLNEARWSIETATKRIAGFEKDIARRIDTTGDAFAMTIGETRFTERKHAGSALIRTIMESAWAQKEAIAGEIGGFEFSLRVMRSRQGGIDDAKVILHLTDQRLTIDMPDEMNALGVIARIESVINRLEIQRDRAQEDLINAEHRISEYQSRLGVPFELQAELDAKLAELAAIDKALAATESEANTGADPSASGAGDQPPEFPAMFARRSSLEDDPTDDVGAASSGADQDE
ncbi:N-6 DNA methylase [Acidiphilium rubrum]|uniref:N-6 DNA methylase n=1 Tax=Acidiphilium rubrum TaxID=526 RepID=UPI002D04F307|nr:N-6 DNA methylase [Acidiphilium rubrum]HQT86674.1 N-6 DNA methylase [Acidiphilium rubrum]